MTEVKMTESIVSTKAFVATLTYPVKNEKQEPFALIEIYPIISQQYKETALAEHFFALISQDQGIHNRHKKETLLEKFVGGCSRRIFEEFWDSTRTATLEKLTQSLLTVQCILYDKAGDIKLSAMTHTDDVIYALKRIEEAFFMHSLPVKMKEKIGAVHAAHKDMRRHQNRRTHKYFLHHRAPR